MNDAFLAGPMGYGGSAARLGLGAFPPNDWTFNQPAGDATVQPSADGNISPLISVTAFSEQTTYLSIPP